MSEHLDDAWKSAVFHGIDKRITAIPFNQDEIVLLPLQGDWVQCEVAVHKQDVITVHFQRHLLIRAPLRSASPTVPDHYFHLMVKSWVPEVIPDVSQCVLLSSVGFMDSL